MKKVLIIFLLSCNVSANAILKDGVCPSGYHQSGSYCIGTEPVILKDGVCPSGYHQSGAYCLGNTENESAIIKKVGTCPSGFYQSGAYCKETR
jgi:hypothetical protein